jgi:hypothetical protein
VRRPSLTVALILSWADTQHARTGQWPTSRSGAIPEAPGETWMAVDKALSKGFRGLPGGQSLALLLRQECGLPERRGRRRRSRTCGAGLPSCGRRAWRPRKSPGSSRSARRRSTSCCSGWPTHQSQQREAETHRPATSSRPKKRAVPSPPDLAPWLARTPFLVGAVGSSCQSVAWCCPLPQAAPPGLHGVLRGPLPTEGFPGLPDPGRGHGPLRLAGPLSKTWRG